MTSVAATAGSVTLASIVNDTLKQFPATTSVFNKFGIDACCGGAVSIRDAAVRDGANPDELISELILTIDGQPILQKKGTDAD